MPYIVFLFAFVKIGISYTSPDATGSKRNVYNQLFPKFDVGFCKYGTDLAKQLVASLHNVLVSCGSVRISFSRRTPEKVHI